MTKFRILERTGLLFLVSILMFYSSPFINVEYKAKDINTIEITVPIGFEDNTEREWQSIASFILTSNYKTYILDWTGYGGSISEGKDFIEALERAKSHGKFIIIKLIGNAYSMHAMVACSANVVLNNGRYFLMYHSPGYFRNNNDYRKTHRSYGPGVDLQFNRCVYKGILTQQDIDTIWNGNEVYVYESYKYTKKDDRLVDD